MRKVYLDNIRWITVVIVVFYHVIFMYNGIETSLTIGPFSDHQPQDVFMYLVYPWFMLLLFVVSGMSARFYLTNHSEKDFLRSRTVKLLVPSTLGLFVFHWIQGFIGALTSEGMAWMSELPVGVRYLIYVVSGQSVLWYIQLLWLFSMMLILIRKVEKNRLDRICSKVNIIVLLLLTIVIYLSAQILNTPMVIVYRFGIYGAGFLIGYFIFSHDEVMVRLEKYWLPLVISALALAVVFSVMYWGQNVVGHEVLDTPMCNIFAWIAVLAILSFMKKYGNFKNSFSEWMNKKSWGLYIFHYLFVSISAYIIKVDILKMPPVFAYLFTAVIAFGGAYLTYEIIRRIPVVRWCVLGLKKPGKEVKG